MLELLLEVFEIYEKHYNKNYIRFEQLFIANYLKS